MWATIKKEFLLLSRDLGGLLLLLIMPAALIVVMAVVQDAPFRDYQEMKFDIQVLNKDKGSVGKKIIEGLQRNKSFVITTMPGTDDRAEALLHDHLKKGLSQMGIIIPAQATTALVHTSNELANEMARVMGLPAGMPVQQQPDTAQVQLLFDPVIKPSFRSSLYHALQLYITQVKMELLMERLGKMNRSDTAQESGISLAQLDAVLVVREQLVGDGPAISGTVNSVQHNVPAWAIFGMFLIVVPLSGNMIRERDDGSTVRILLIPDAVRRVGIGKIFFYMMVCLLQFTVMLLVGLYLLPLFGLPALYLGTYPLLLLPVAICIAFAAVSFGYFIGCVFKTANQAMPCGAISVVLFSAMGGVWVPVEILPRAMQTIALCSPMYWSLEGINQVLLRGAGLSGILTPCALLVTLGMVLVFLPVFFSKK